ncbi:MAG: hypothetical protein EBT92_04045 [Planctomycetes bacterium]|nr:hypothetical protein [Planctomycetota bacterium]NBY01848.1 hypothetical protein [Planctomycetota bacterium]
MKILGNLNIWAGSNKLPSNVGKLDRYLYSRILQLEPLEGRITPATFTVVNTSDSGTGSLRQAILDANLSTGPDIINFAIVGGTGAIHTITPTSALPLITDQVAIDGTTQSLYTANTLLVGAGNNAAIKIQLDGSNLNNGEVGLYLNSSGSSVKGLSLVNFPYAIYANGNNITIKGNYFGVNADGTAQSKGLSGVGVDVATVNSVTIGGNNAADQNIFGNLTIGILQIAGSGGNFTGNRVGMGRTNTSFMPNTIGIQINNNANVDALNHSISANLIGKNTTGINLIGFQGTTGNNTGKVIGTQIVGNLIGTDGPGSTINLGNSGNAISIADGVINTTIGISTDPNTIAYSGQDGVFINGAASMGNTIEYNNIRNNTSLGIRLLNGANSNIAPPVLTQQQPNVTGGFTYSGFVNGIPSTTYTVDFYSSLISDSRSQGANYLGSTTVTTDASGNIGFTGFIPTQNQSSQGAGYVVTATATNVGFGTSQFSAGPPAQISVVSGSGQSALVGTAFANPLTARVVDSRGDPVPNIQVRFAAPNANPPTNPATGTFPGNQQTIIAITNTAGLAVSTTLTANNAPGNFTVLSSIVGNPGITSISFALTNTPPAPTITSFTPISGPVGTPVVITGSGFIGPVQVKFGGITATVVTVNSATQITAMVPLGATSGPISIITSAGTVFSGNDFTVTTNAVSSFKVELANPGQAVIVGVPVSIKITALNSSGGVVSNFAGPVNISTTDPLVTIPSIVNFTSVDNGVVVINAVFRTPGQVTITATFQGNGATGSGSGIVLQGSSGPFQVSPPSSPVPFPLGISITKDLAILTGVTLATVSDYVATVVWGDGSPNSVGAITPAPNQPGVFQVLGTHTYNSLEVFTGSVTVTRISDNTNSSSSFTAVVLTPAQKNNLNGANGSVLPPGGRFADARVNGINAFYNQPATNPRPVILVTASFIGNPQPYAPTIPAQQFYDVRLINPEAGALLSITCSFSGGLQRGSSPYLQFAQDTSTSYQNVISANNLVIINYIDSTITVYLNQTSFPLIDTLRGTVFAVVTNTTQVSSNTITILPAAFTGGTAVGIAWGDSSTLIDIAKSANASNTTLTFQNSRQTTLTLAPSQSAGTVLFRTSNYGGTTNDDAGKETIKQLTNPDIIQNIIRGTIGIGPEVISSMIKKMMPENTGEFFKQWSKVISEIKTVPNDMITPEVKATPQTNNGSSNNRPEEFDDSLFDDEAFENVSKIRSILVDEDEYDSCLNAPSPDPILEELASAGEINWAGLALSTLALSQFRAFSRDKSNPVRSIKISA